MCTNPSQNISDEQVLLGLRELITREGQIYLVIDALDECDSTLRSGEESEVDKLVNFLVWLADHSRNLHLLMTSRDGSSLAAPLEHRLHGKASFGTHRALDLRAVDLASPEIRQMIQHDIEKLVSFELRRWNERKGRLWLPLSPQKQKQVADGVTERANGM
jgi:hypothetical protein